MTRARSSPSIPRCVSAALAGIRSRWSKSPCSGGSSARPTHSCRTTSSSSTSARGSSTRVGCLVGRSRRCAGNGNESADLPGLFTIAALVSLWVSVTPLQSMPTISLSTAAKAERVTLENLMQLYIYDWSELRPLDVDGDGRFEADALDTYFEDDWRHPLLLRVDGRLAGFALVSRRSRLTGAASVFDMSEFFVMRRYRRKGVGLAAAAAAFDHFKGPW